MTTLAPMSLGDLLDGSFALLRRNFATLAGISAICYGPFQAISLYAQTAAAGSSTRSSWPPGCWSPRSARCSARRRSSR